MSGRKATPSFPNMLKYPEQDYKFKICVLCHKSDKSRVTWADAAAIPMHSSDRLTVSTLSPGCPCGTWTFFAIQTRDMTQWIWSPLRKGLIQPKTDLALVCPAVVMRCQPSLELMQEDSSMNWREERWKSWCRLVMLYVCGLLEFQWHCKVNGQVLNFSILEASHGVFFMITCHFLKTRAKICGHFCVTCNEVMELKREKSGKCTHWLD